MSDALEGCSRFTVEEFLEDCRSGYLTDYDGNGYYGDLVTEWHDSPAIPSEFVAGRIDTRFTHVYWYNK